MDDGGGCDGGGHCGHEGSTGGYGACDPSGSGDRGPGVVAFCFLGAVGLMLAAAGVKTILEESPRVATPTAVVSAIGKIRANALPPVLTERLLLKATH